MRRIRSVLSLLVVAAPATAQSPSPEVTPFVHLPGQEAVRTVGEDARPPVGQTPFLDGRPVAPGGTLIVDPGCQPAPDTNPFLANHRSVQTLVGVYVSSRPGPAIPSFNYIPTTFRYSWMLNDANPENRWPGNWEYLCELTVASIFSDYGSYFISPACVWRYNFAHPDSEIVPYTQLGLGFAFNDAFKDKDQHAIGALTEFIAHWEIGAKYFVSQNWSLDIEGGIQHISNSSTAGRNLGVNAFGIALGLTYYFPSGAN